MSWRFNKNTISEREFSNIGQKYLEIYYVLFQGWGGLNASWIFTAHMDKMMIT